MSQEWNRAVSWQEPESSAAPDGGAALAALDVLVASGQVRADDVVVLFNTGGALKYLQG